MKELKKQIYDYLKKTQCYKTKKRIEKEKRKGPVNFDKAFYYNPIVANMKPITVDTMIIIILSIIPSHR